jgi:hypothetical protein
MATIMLLIIITSHEESYVPTQIGRGLWRSPAGLVYRSDKLFTGDELKRQEIAAGFDVGPVPPRSPQQIKLAYGVDQPAAMPSSITIPEVIVRRQATDRHQQETRLVISPRTGAAERAETSVDDTPDQSDGERRKLEISSRRSPAESQHIGGTDERIVRSEFSISVLAVDVQDTCGVGKLWQTSFHFQSSERGWSTLLIGILLCVAPLLVAIAWFAGNRFHCLHRSLDWPEEIRRDGPVARKL